MGVVYKARDVQLQRLVALKMILAGAHAGPDELARFRTEAEAVARLQHPHIVQIHAIGEHEGLPYFSLEFVEGGSLAQKLAGTPLPPREAAQLVETLARAMHIAHQRGIIHRDLKPANVLLTADGQPKITDFGLAKKLDGAAGQTASGAIVGTPSYMAPEQANGQVKPVGPAVDVYALGAVLYETLTGRPPFKAATPLDTVLQVVSAEPAPPGRLQPHVPRDLETICLKCLHKEPARRYPDAAALAEDLRRYQASEPIMARPVGVMERGLKWARRRPAAAALIGFVVLALVGTAVGGVWYAGHERDRANQESTLRQAAEDQRERAEQAEQQAKRSEADAQAVLDFFQDHVLAAARPKSQNGGLGIHATIRAAVDAAEPEIAGAFPDRPLVEASIRNTLGMTYVYLRDDQAAIQQYERALELRSHQLGPDHPDTLQSLNNLATAYHEAGQLAKALPLLKQTLEQCEQKLGPDHCDTLRSMNNLATAYRDAGQRDKAVPLYEQTLAKCQQQLGADDSLTLTTLNNLAGAYEEAGQFAKAISLFEQTLATFQAKFGPDHPGTLTSMNNLARAHYAAGQLAKALALWEQTLAKCKEQFGPDHPYTLTTLNNLANAYHAAGQLDRALPLLEQTLVKRKEKLGPDHPETLTSMNNLAAAYYAVGQFAKALPLLEQALAKQKAQLGPDHPDTLYSMNNLAKVYTAVGQLEKALPLYEETVVKRREKLGAGHPNTLNTMSNLGNAYLKHGDFTKAERILRACWTLRQEKQPDGWTTFETQSACGASLLGQERYAEAEPLLLAGYTGMKQRQAQIPANTNKSLTEALERLVQLYDAWGKPEQANEWRHKLDQAKDAKK
jgi:tetratricopeptide (TPR) repeat protein